MGAPSFLLVLVALAAGAIVAIQPGINGALYRRLEHPIQAAVISFTVGWATLVAACLALGQRLPRPSMLASAPWWLWLGGGTVGACFVTTALIVAPRIGAAWWVALIVAGQMLASLALDHFGLLGFRQRPIDPRTLLGAGLVIAGVTLISLARRG
ncbi:MAG: DMT family transporter [Planctomycetes bacterium]|nr:DMT family transporter [Planctomycetota bacterium]